MSAWCARLSSGEFDKEQEWACSGAWTAPNVPNPTADQQAQKDAHAKTECDRLCTSPNEWINRYGNIPIGVPTTVPPYNMGMCQVKKEPYSYSQTKDGLKLKDPFPSCDGDTYKGVGAGCQNWMEALDSAGIVRNVQLVNKFDVVSFNDAIRLGFAKAGDGWDQRQTVNGASKVPDGSTAIDGVYTGSPTTNCVGCPAIETTKIPGYEDINYPRLLEFINGQLTTKGCSANQLPFRVTSTVYKNAVLYQDQGLKGDTAIKMKPRSGNTGPITEMVNLVTIMFPCAGPLGSADCVAPERTASVHDRSTPWEYTKYQFVFQILVPVTGIEDDKVNMNEPIQAKIIGIPTYTWDCEKAAPSQLVWCGGAVGMQELDAIMGDALAKMRFGVAKALAVETPTKTAYQSSYNLCSDGLCSDNTCINGLHDDCSGYQPLYDTGYDPEKARHTCRKNGAGC